VVIAILSYISMNANDKMRPEWSWDRNIYLPEGGEMQGTRFNLMVQVVSSRSLKQLSDIVSIPNRAYARQWAVDYATVSSGRMAYSSHACFDKVYVLNTLLEQQQDVWPRRRGHYDSVLLLPPDSIVTDLDQNIFDMLPTNKLVAIGGWDTSDVDSNSDVILFNMQHKYAGKVAKLWWDLVRHPGITCGSNTDLGILISAIENVLAKGETLEDMIEPVRETADGFVGDRSIKCIPPSVPSSRTWLLMSNLQESVETLQETAESVCYRFYPKCEVL